MRTSFLFLSLSIFTLGCHVYELHGEDCDPFDVDVDEDRPLHRDAGAPGDAGDVALCAVDGDCAVDRICETRSGECVPSAPCTDDRDCDAPLVCDARGTCASPPAEEPTGCRD